ncbi:S1 family peptidase [Demequina salsinemoris]|uniref:S1 family peptidase n=1 Tax=Demequina salsinemoris TaxID=577470 RepID=UPI0007835D22|nr:serine protease [Demequina salsinemoris]
MRRPALLLLAPAALLAGCASLPSSPPPLPDSFVPATDATAAEAYVSSDGFTHAEHASYRVRVRTCTGYATGTAFAIDEHTLVTNRHVVDESVEVEVTSYDGHELEVVSTQVDTEADLAVLTVDDTLDEWLAIADEESAKGDTVTVSGYPEGESLTTVSGPLRGTVDEVFGTDPDDVLLVRVPAAPGSSGSAVVNDKSEVVGVLYAIDADEDGWSYAVSLESLTAMLDDTSMLDPVVGLCAE